jgi:hypothetical protein
MSQIPDDSRLPSTKPFPDFVKQFCSVYLIILQLGSAMTIIGNLYDRLRTVLTIGHQSSYLFLGDSVSRGQSSVECITLGPVTV